MPLYYLGNDLWLNCEALRVTRVRGNVVTDCGDLLQDPETLASLLEKIRENTQKLREEETPTP